VNTPTYRAGMNIYFSWRAISYST